MEYSVMEKILSGINIGEKILIEGGDNSGFTLRHITGIYNGDTKESVILENVTEEYIYGRPVEGKIVKKESGVYMKYHVYNIKKLD